MENDREDGEFMTLDQVALAIITGGDKIGDFLKTDSGENGLTCEQAMSAHCSGKCTNRALELLREAQKQGKAGKKP